MAMQQSARPGLALVCAAQFPAREIDAVAQAGALPLRAVHEPDLIRLPCAGEGPVSEPLGAPVVLVHGYPSKHEVWTPIVARLHKAGFTNLWCLSYRCAGQTVPRQAASLVEQLGEASSAPAHLIGHSLGGLLIRYALEFHHLRARSVTLIATPNKGSRVAYLSLGELAAHLRPGSSSIRKLADRPLRPRAPWTVYYSRSDLVVPPNSAVVDGGAPLVTNVHIDGHGHLSILRSAALANDLVDRLSRFDPPTVAGLSRHLIALAA